MGPAPVRFLLTAGRAADINSAPDLVAGLTTGGVIVDKADDSTELRELIDQAGAEVVIPSNRSWKILIPHDVIAYKAQPDTTAAP